MVEVNQGAATVNSGGQSRQVKAGRAVTARAGEPPADMGEGAATPQATATSTAICQYAAAFIGDITAPPGTVLPPNQQFDKIWRLRNTGTCAWLDYAWALASGDPLGGPVAVAVPRTEPGGTVDIGVPLRAPQAPGDYTALWQLRDASGQHVGEAVGLEVVVGTALRPDGDLHPRRLRPTSAPGSTSIALIKS